MSVGLLRMTNSIQEDVNKRILIGDGVAFDVVTLLQRLHEVVEKRQLQGCVKLALELSMVLFPVKDTNN